MICVILSKLRREIEREEKTNISGKYCRCPKRNKTQSQRNNCSENISVYARIQTWDFSVSMQSLNPYASLISTTPSLCQRFPFLLPPPRHIFDRPDETKKRKTRFRFFFLTVTYNNIDDVTDDGESQKFAFRSFRSFHQSGHLGSS